MPNTSHGTAISKGAVSFRTATATRCAMAVFFRTLAFMSIVCVIRSRDNGITPIEGTLMTYDPLTLDLALDMHEERIANASRRRRGTATRRDHFESADGWPQQRSASSAWLARRFRGPRATDLAALLILAGEIIEQHSAAELDGPGRPALAAVVDGLLKAAHEGGVDVSSIGVDADDPAIVLHRTLGRLAAVTVGDSIPVNRRRARTLRTSLDELGKGSAEPAADRSARRTYSCGEGRAADCAA